MRLILRGGYSKEIDGSYNKSFWVEYRPIVEKLVKAGRKVVVVTLAKPDGYFNEFLNKWPNEVTIINSKTKSVEWGELDTVMIPGGMSTDLIYGLKSIDFDIKKLKPSTIVLGDSAGAYVMSTYFYDSPRGKDRGRIIRFLRGFNKDARIITVAHSNNQIYSNDTLLKKVNTLAKEKGLKVLVLKENEEKLVFEDARIATFDRNRMFHNLY